MLCASGHQEYFYVSNVYEILIPVKNHTWLCIRPNEDHLKSGSMKDPQFN